MHILLARGHAGRQAKQKTDDDRRYVLSLDSSLESALNPYTYANSTRSA